MNARPLSGTRVLAVVAPRDYRDEELTEPRRILEANGARVDISSSKPGTCTGMMGGRCEATVALSKVDPTAYDAVFVVGGGGSRTHLWENADLRRILRTLSERGRVTAAICLSGAVLAKAGLLEGKKATVWDEDDAIQALRDGGATYVERGPVVDGRVVTAYGPPEAAAFGNALVSQLERAHHMSV